MGTLAEPPDLCIPQKIWRDVWFIDKLAFAACSLPWIFRSSEFAGSSFASIKKELDELEM